MSVVHGRSPLAGPFERRRHETPLAHPARLIAFSFLAAIAVGTVILMLPVARAGPESPPFLTALFTATSAVCVTGLTVVDTPTYWSSFGQAALLVLFQVGGLGFMTLTSLTAVLLGRRIGLRQRVLAEMGAGASNLGSARRVLLWVGGFSIVFEAITATILTLRFALAYDESPGQALWHGVFHAVSAFNQAGFALWSDSLVRFATDPVIVLATGAAIMVAGLGVPVWIELRDRALGRDQRLSLHTRLVLAGTALLFVTGVATVLIFEWRNPETLGGLDTGGKLLAGFFEGVTPRSAGLATVDYGEMRPDTLLVQTMLMFVGGAPASPAGGIKVTTFLILVLFVLSELRGMPDTSAFGRRLPFAVIRQAFTVAFVALNAVVVAALILMLDSRVSLTAAIFESVSAFATVGLSTGITPDLSVVSKLVLVGMMFVGRTGPYILAVALALRLTQQKFRYPEERPIIG